jgi:N-acetylglucosamine-6-sulfatase
MHRTSLVVAVALALLASSVPAAQAPHATAAKSSAADKSPNIVVVYIDDAAVHDGRLWNDADVTRTLHERFVARGINFSNAIVENPLCCPARGNLLTGLHTHNNGLNSNHAHKFDPSMHIGRALGDAGYATMYLGKYLNRADLLSADEWATHAAGWTNFDVTKGANGQFYDYTLYTKEGDIPFGKYHSTRMIADRFELRSRQVPADQPLFAVLSIYNLHGPNTPMPEFAGDMRCSAMPPWNPPNYNEADMSDKPAFQQTRALLPYPDGWPMVGYCEEMLGVDWAVERVVDELRAQDRLDNTLLVFTADNGMGWGAHRIGQNKRSPHTTPVPLYMSWPARWGRESRTIAEHTSNIDLAPTFCDIAGCTVGPFRSGQAGPDGVSLLPLVDGDVSHLGRDAVFELHTDPGQTRTWTALRTTALHAAGLWHYVEWSTGERELYDLDADPWELENVAGKSEHAALMSELAQRLAQLRAEGRSTASGSIRIVVDAIPNSTRNFSYSGDLGSFQLDDDSDATLPRARTFSRAPGAYTVTQADDPRWSLTAISCNSSQTVDLANRRVTVNLTANASVECTFTNVRRQPDAMIAFVSGGPYKGDDRYSATPIKAQTRKYTGAVVGKTYKFWVRVQNDSRRTDSFRLRATETGPTTMRARYWRGNVEITSQVLAGTYAIDNLAAGAHVAIEVRVVVKTGTSAGSVKRVLLEASSHSRPAQVDVVRAVVAR